MTDKKIIYDVGSNNGDDIPYYLKKADAVIAVEANPLLCRHVEDRFSEEIASGRLCVENCVITTGSSSNEVYFYIHKRNHTLSQFPTPNNIADFEKVLLPAKSVIELISEHGEPYYIKIDIEDYDEMILRVLFEHNIRPPFISAEAKSIEVFSLLVSLGKYSSYKLVDGNSVVKVYKDHTILVNDKKEKYSFPYHSAGPFGDDIYGDWMSADNFFRLLAFENFGWKDIHATNSCPPNANIKLTRYLTAVKRGAVSRLRATIPGPTKEFIRQIMRIAPTRPHL